MQVQSVFDRLQRLLGDASAAATQLLQPTADALAARLGLAAGEVATFSEEVVRGTAAAALAQLLAALDPR